jgi:hypothetical protein
MHLVRHPTLRRVLRFLAIGIGLKAMFFAGAWFLFALVQHGTVAPI